MITVLKHKLGLTVCTCRIFIFFIFYFFPFCVDSLKKNCPLRYKINFSFNRINIPPTEAKKFKQELKLISMEKRNEWIVEWISSGLGAFFLQVRDRGRRFSKVVRFARTHRCPFLEPFVGKFPARYVFWVKVPSDSTSTIIYEVAPKWIDLLDILAGKCSIIFFPFFLSISERIAPRVFSSAFLARNVIVCRFVGWLSVQGLWHLESVKCCVIFLTNLKKKKKKNMPYNNVSLNKN